MDNFIFLKTIDKNLYEIILDAEKLYKDEYFEQCIGQTRRFGENVCKNVLGDSRTCETSFDDMLATLKDKTSSIQEKEFIEDLYFLKKEGNASVHSSSVKQNGLIALECLQRAFEIAINYAVYYKKSNSNLLKLQYDTELLITGKKSKKTLKERYQEEKNKTLKAPKQKINKTKKKKNYSYPKIKISIYKTLLGISSIISLILIFTIFLLSFVS